VFYVERFVELDTKNRGSWPFQNGKLARADGLGELWRGYFCVRLEATKGDLTAAFIAPRMVHCGDPEERTGLAVLV
jgi:hypothetical protein